MIFILAPAEFRFRLQFPLTLLQIVIDFVSLALQSFNIFNCEIKLYQDFTCLDLHRTGLDLLTFKHLWTGNFIWNYIEIILKFLYKRKIIALNSYDQLNWILSLNIPLFLQIERYSNGFKCRCYLYNYPCFSFINLFVLLTTANYPDVMMPSYADNPLSAAFFISYLGKYFNLIMYLIYMQRSVHPTKRMIHIIIYNL